MPSILRYRGRIRTTLAPPCRVPLVLLPRFASTSTVPARAPPRMLRRSPLPPPSRPVRGAAGQRTNEPLPRTSGSVYPDRPKGGNLPPPNTAPWVKRDQNEPRPPSSVRRQEEQAVMTRLREILVAQHEAIQAEAKRAALPAPKSGPKGNSPSSTATVDPLRPPLNARSASWADRPAQQDLFEQMLAQCHLLLSNGSFPALEACIDLVLGLIVQRADHPQSDKALDLIRRFYLESLLFNRPSDEQRTMQYARYYAMHVMNRVHLQMDRIKKKQSEEDNSASPPEILAEQEATGKSPAQEMADVVDPYLNSIHDLVKSIADRKLPPALSEPIWAIMLYLQQWSQNEWLPPVQLIRPAHRVVIDLLGNMLRERGVSSMGYDEALTHMATLYCYRPLPGSDDDLVNGIQTLVDRREPELLIILWLRYRTRIGPKDEKRGYKANQLDPLSKFISALLNPTMDTGNFTAYPSPRQYAAQAVSLCPRPLPAVIHHVILRDRSRMVGEVLPLVDRKNAALRVPESIGSHVKPVPTRNGLAYKDMLDAWKDCGNDGCRDVEAYMVYIAALAKIHAVDLLEKLWAEFLVDDAAREMWRTDQGARMNVSRKAFDKDQSADGEIVQTDVDPEVWPPTAILNHLISALFYCGEPGFTRALDLARASFEPGSKLQGDVITLNTIMRHYARHIDIAKMQQTMAVAEALNIKVDVVTFTTLIQGVLRAQRPELVPGILTDMAEKGIRPNGRLMSLLVADLAKAGERPALQRADKFIQSMKAQGNEPSVETWTSLISGYLRGAWMADAWDTLDRARAEGIKFNALAYNFMLGQTRAEDVPAVFDEMLRHGVDPNADTYWLAISKLCDKKMWDEMETVVAMLEKQGARIRWKPSLVRMVKGYREMRPRLLTDRGVPVKPEDTEALYASAEVKAEGGEKESLYEETEDSRTRRRLRFAARIRAER